LKDLQAFCRALASPARLKILRLLGSHPLCVNALAGRLGLSAAATSQHLRLLREQGLVQDDKRGLFVHYRRDDEAFREGLDRLRNFWEESRIEEGLLGDLHEK
jgi:DNA-binding transcriptional ArsR family regulator